MPPANPSARFAPSATSTSAERPDYAEVVADLRTCLHAWMVKSSDPLLDGPIRLPAGAGINLQTQRSAEEPTEVVEALAMGRGRQTA